MHLAIHKNGFARFRWRKIQISAWLKGERDPKIFIGQIAATVGDKAVAIIVHSSGSGLKTN